MGTGEHRFVAIAFAVVAVAIVSGVRMAVARLRAGPVPQEAEERVYYWLRRGRRIAALRAAQEIVGGGLGEARAYVERAETGR